MKKFILYSFSILLSYSSAQASCGLIANAGADVTVCSGASISIGGSPTASSGSGTYTYFWTPSTGLNSATISNPTVTVYATASFVVTVNDGVCSKNDTIIVNVIATPTLTTSNITICIAGSANLTVSGAVSYLWAPSTSLSATTGSSVTADPGSTKTYTITGTGSNGCSSSASATVVVNSLYSLNAGSDVTICKGGTTLLNGSGATLYSWSPTSTLSSATIYNPIASPTTTTDYFLSDPSCPIFPPSNVTVYVSSLPSFAVSPASTTICTGTPTNIMAGGASTYFWNPATSLNTVTGATVITSATASITYTVTGTNGNGCTKSLYATITTSNLPPVVNISSNTTICSGTFANLTVSGAVSYFWNPATGLSSATGTAITANPVVTTTYSVTGTTNCGSNTQTVTVEVNSIPTITVSGPVSICKGSSGNLIANGATTYNWSPSGTLNSSITASVTASPTVTTTYSVTGSLNGCNSSPASITLMVSNCSSSGIEENLFSNSFKLYPNPTNGSTTITFNTDRETSIIIRLTDMKGNEIYKEFKNQFNGEYKSNIDLSKEAKGIYMLNVITDQGTVNKKIIVE